MSQRVGNRARDPLQQALRALRGGGVVAYPTEGCYGLGCDPRNTRAVERILRLKKRSRRSGLILIGAHWRHLAPWVDASDEAAVARARETWPGPHTWLLPAGAGVSPWVRGEHDTIAVRLTAHPPAAALCRRFNAALVSTSANLHGEPPALDAMQVRRMFSHGLDFILSGPLGDSNGPTPIGDARTGERVRGV
ncbi:MAG: Threonylcarbamoyl-AMP synthase [Gammaproteobacteria bacterium]|nr:Threonylcarbamoyl-AMP synthase [Gammaproteobacteria bacterium]